MDEFEQMTVKQLKRHLSEKKLPVSGKKDDLVKRIRRHAKTQEIQTAQPSTTTELNLSTPFTFPNDLNWTSDLSICPNIRHDSIYRYRITDRHLTGGYKLFIAKKVETMLVASQGRDFYCKGRVSASMRLKRYLVEVKCTETDIVAVNCNCPVGSGKCKHTVALLYALVGYLLEGLDTIPDAIACTSQPRQWGRATTKIILDNVPSFSELAPKAVNPDPDNPGAASTHARHVQRRLDYTSIPPQRYSLRSSQREDFLEDHSFWSELVTTESDSVSLSVIEVTQKRYIIIPNFYFARL